MLLAISDLWNIITIIGVLLLSKSSFSLVSGGPTLNLPMPAGVASGPITAAAAAAYSWPTQPAVLKLLLLSPGGNAQPRQPPLPALPPTPSSRQQQLTRAATDADPRGTSLSAAASWAVTAATAPPPVVSRTAAPAPSTQPAHVLSAPQPALQEVAAAALTIPSSKPAALMPQPAPPAQPATLLPSTTAGVTPPAAAAGPPTAAAAAAPVMTAAAAVPAGAQLPEGYTLPDYEAPIDAEAKLWKLLGDHLQVSKVPCGRLQGVLAACAPPSPFPAVCVVFSASSSLRQWVPLL